MDKFTFPWVQCYSFFFFLTQNGSSSASLELDLEHYVVPAPATAVNSGLIYAANMTETPRSLTCAGVFSNSEGSGSVLQSYKDGGMLGDRPAAIKVGDQDNMSVSYWILLVAMENF